jgi:hypothetical protein
MNGAVIGLLMLLAAWTPARGQSLVSTGMLANALNSYAREIVLNSVTTTTSNGIMDLGTISGGGLTNVTIVASTNAGWVQVGAGDWLAPTNVAGAVAGGIAWTDYTPIAATAHQAVVSGSLITMGYAISDVGGLWKSNNYWQPTSTGLVVMGATLRVNVPTDKLGEVYLRENGAIKRRGVYLYNAGVADDVIFSINAHFYCDAATNRYQLYYNTNVTGARTTTVWTASSPVSEAVWARFINAGE